MVVVVADDPGPISSQTEQDTRRFGQFSKLPVFDPSSPEEAYEMIGMPFEYSGEISYSCVVPPYHMRLCHGCASVELKERVKLPAPEGLCQGFRQMGHFPQAVPCKPQDD